MIIEVNLDIFKASIILFIGERINNIQKYVDNKYPWWGTVEDITNVTMHRSSVSIIILEKDWEFSTLHHEIFHACDLILRGKGMKLSYSSEESWAYCIGYTTGEIYKRLKVKTS